MANLAAGTPPDAIIIWSPPVVICAPSVILSPTYQAIWKRVVHEGHIGRVHLARGRYGWSGPTWGQWY